jgi:2-alkyl-3-oxoalkanoate reductase
MMSSVHLDDAAAATVLALGVEGPGIYNVTDDEPSPMRDWLPGLASALGVQPPRRLPAWVAGLLMGKTLALMTEARGASNERAKKGLGWTPRYPSWRDGFPAAFGRPAGHAG